MLRLDTIDSGLVAMIDAASDTGRRDAAVAAASLAQERTGLSDQRVVELLRTLREGQTGDSAERRAVDALVEELDNLQWEIQDRVDTGDADAEEHLGAFSRARAASAVAFAAAADPRSAAMEGLYEAAIAIDDLDSLRNVVQRVIS